MSVLAETGEFVTGHPALDHDHDVFLTLLAQLAVAGNPEFPTLFQNLLRQTEQHFAQEEHLMQQHAFPAMAEHQGEHRRVLGEFHQFKPRIDKGLIAFGRPFVQERLPLWFKLHVATMDYALALHIERRNNH